MSAADRRPQSRINSNYTRQLSLHLLLLFLALITCFNSASAGKAHLSIAYIEKIGRQYGPEAKQRLLSWKRLIKNNEYAPEEMKLRRVNTFFNKLKFVDDIEHWQQEDYWATPVEFLISNGGDCEDFSIAKYYTLREMGVADEKLSIAYVKALDYNEAHMVLTYYKKPNSTPLVLDNLIAQIKPANERPDLHHVYSFNGNNLWLSKKGKRAKIIGTSDRLEHWVKLRERLSSKTIKSTK